MQVFDFSPIKLSLNTWVSLLALKGKCVPLRLNARIHSFNANKDLLISAPSIPKNFNNNRNYVKALACLNDYTIVYCCRQLNIRLLTSLSISRRRVSTSFIASKINERKLSVHLVCARNARYYLKHRVWSRRVGISARLTACPGAVSMLY